ncbi:1,4-dihydroxy-2-naphthoate octaprenyltransferase [Neisseria chenwenguii]|uniref:1,4-dihydroxy-2-naphthoate octaprenyltransferase n=1 Tax=Neisseria chenwenguii TaxID=1853278 RepID=A0A220S4X1_9NEIS|nr:1,4-dihydroxy-2-naphthoate octaprenyltransferase [Neisseria chenwenguii]ASK28492.1 1,4-dihydroxy-2-naphthoate octaprenyltransferase [Neisseria chenwenguii]ROV55640.1 1,4-dihydroxy-2-naphthoate octaprenyltransferase [Neisseria chenwenguii]
MNLRYWLAAARLRTLPLALAGTLAGSLAAAVQHRADFAVAVLSTATAVSLQMFANFANDYGDGCRGTDGASRRGPQRMVGSGRIARQTMKRALCLSAAVCCLLGLALLAAAFGRTGGFWAQTWPWLAAGALSLAAAYGYTAGHKPYGYAGFGDLAVFVFFGLLAVAGTAFLQTGRLNAVTLLPACAVGFWCVMVLNLNNMRDIEGDAASGKRTLAVRLGLARAKRYHTALALTAAMCWGVWLLRSFSGTGLAALCGLLGVLTAAHLVMAGKARNSADFDKLLPQWSMAVSAWVAALWVAALLGAVGGY